MRGASHRDAPQHVKLAAKRTARTDADEEEEDDDDDEDGDDGKGDGRVYLAEREEAAEEADDPMNLGLGRVGPSESGDQSRWHASGLPGRVGKQHWQGGEPGPAPESGPGLNWTVTLARIPPRAGRHGDS